MLIDMRVHHLDTEVRSAFPESAMRHTIKKTASRLFLLLMTLSWLCHGDTITIDNVHVNGLSTEAAERQGHEEKTTTEVRFSIRSNVRLDAPIGFHRSRLVTAIARTPSCGSTRSTRITSRVPVILRV